MAPTAPGKVVKKVPAASRPTRTGNGKGKTHTSLGVAKAPHRSDKRTSKQRKADTERLEKTLPTLNTVVPAGALGKIKGGHGKIGKVFIDDNDKDKMMRFVEQAAGKHEKGEESKLERARKVEAIRESRRREDDAKEAQRREKLDDTKKKIQKKRKPKGFRLGDEQENPEKIVDRGAKTVKPKKKVGFA